jgi:hypothetical protein
MMLFDRAVILTLMRFEEPGRAPNPDIYHKSLIDQYFSIMTEVASEVNRGYLAERGPRAIWRVRLSDRGWHPKQNRRETRWRYPLRPEPAERLSEERGRASFKLPA